MGASNLAARRAAKANRRKVIVAQKRRAEAVAGTVTGQVANATTAPIRYCLMTGNLFELGMGTLILARGGSSGPVVVGGFLLDTFCRGIKDVLLHTMEAAQLEVYLDTLSLAAPVVSIEPSYARKLLRDLARWSSSLGFPPAREFVAVERLFGDVDAQACDASFEFGHAGKPLFISGPNEPLAVARREVGRFSERLGEGGVDYLVAANEAAL